MSPEQVRGEAIDARSDLFGLGCVLYALCTGHPPFRSETSYAVLRRITDDTPRPIREINPDVPEWLEQIVMKLLAKSPNERFDSAEQVGELLEGCLAHVQQPTVSPLPMAVAALSSGGREFPPSFKFIAASAFAFLIFVAGVFVTIELNKGTLTIESNADDVPIRILQDGETVQRLTVKQSGETVRIAAGNYVVVIDTPTDELRIEDGQVVLRRGESEIVRVVHTATRSEQAKTTAKDVAFVLGDSSFEPGDNIEIESITSTGEGFEIGATVTVKGQYTLKSNEHAHLGFYSTVALKPGETPVGTPIQRSQMMDAKKGTHLFTLTKRITAIGSPHITFYHPETGRGMGGVYFAEQVGKEELSEKVLKSNSTLQVDPDATTANLLDGTWEVELSSPAKAKRSGFAAFAGNVGVIGSSDDETAPLRFTYDIQPQNEQLWIDLRSNDGAPDGGPCLWQGIVEASRSSIKLCFAREDQVKQEGRPTSIEDANSDVFVTVAFTRKNAARAFVLPEPRSFGLSAEQTLPPLRFGNSPVASPTQIGEVDASQSARLDNGSSVASLPYKFGSGKLVPVESLSGQIEKLLGSWRVMTMTDEKGSDVGPHENMVLTFDGWTFSWLTEPDELSRYIYRQSAGNTISFVNNDDSIAEMPEGSIAYSFEDGNHLHIKISSSDPSGQRGWSFDLERIVGDEQPSAFASRTIAVDVGETYGWSEDSVVDMHGMLVRSPVLLGAIRWPNDIAILPNDVAERLVWLSRNLEVETTEGNEFVFGIHGHITTKEQRERIVRLVAEAYHSKISRADTPDGKQEIERLIREHSDTCVKREKAEAAYRAIIEAYTVDARRQSDSHRKLKEINDALTDLQEQLLGYGVPGISGSLDLSIERATRGIPAGENPDAARAMSLPAKPSVE